MDNLVCPICGKQFNHKKKFSDHRRVHDITVFNCEECGLDVTGLKSMVAHKAVHKKIECKTCGISLKANTLTSHKYKYYPDYIMFSISFTTYNQIFSLATSSNQKELGCYYHGKYRSIIQGSGNCSFQRGQFQTF